MKIKVRNDAKKYYINTLPRYQPINWKWAGTLEQVQGMTLEVETKYLFNDQFNTAPIPGISENGLRLMADNVAYVIDDIRPGKSICAYCHHWSKAEQVCPHCEQKGYLKPFKTIAFKMVTHWRRSRYGVHYE